MWGRFFETQCIFKLCCPPRRLSVITTPCLKIGLWNLVRTRSILIDLRIFLYFYKQNEISKRSYIAIYTTS